MSGDWCTTNGARKLKDKIEAYWRERGYDVDIDLVEAGFIAAMRSGRTDVRSNMVNGMPTRRDKNRDGSVSTMRSSKPINDQQVFSLAG